MIDTCKHVCAKKNKPALIVSQSRQCIIRGQKKKFNRKFKCACVGNEIKPLKRITLVDLTLNNQTTN